jgi:hypothetical protein
VAAQPPPLAEEPDAEALKILGRMGDFYRRLEHAAARVTCTVAVTSPQDGAVIQTITSVYDFSFSRPGLIAFRALSGAAAEITCDGRRIAVFVPATARFMEMEAPPDLGERMTVAGNALKHTGSPTGGLEAVALHAILADDPRQTLRGRVRSLGLHESGGRTVQRVRFLEDRGHVDFWVDAGEHPWLVRVEPDVPGLPEQLARSVRVAMRVEFESWSAEPVAPAAFAFAPPPDAQRAASLIEAMGIPEEEEPLEVPQVPVAPGVEAPPPRVP